MRARRPAILSFSVISPLMAEDRTNLQSREVGIDHHRHHLLEGDGWLPFQLAPRFAGVANQMIHFCRTEERRIDPHILLPVESGMRERDLNEVFHRMADAGSDDVVVSLILLQ